MVEAVGRIVVEQGLEGIRIRQIAAEAGLSTGAVLYHFPKQDDLLFAVHQDVVQQYLSGRQGAISAEADAATQLLDVMTAGVPPWADEKVIRLLYALHGLALRSTPHSELLSELWASEHALYADIVRTGVRHGLYSLAQEPEDVATQLLALEDGLALHYTSRNSLFSPSYILNSFASAAAAILGCPMLVDYAASRLKRLLESAVTTPGR